MLWRCCVGFGCSCSLCFHTSIGVGDICRCLRSLMRYGVIPAAGMQLPYSQWLMSAHEQREGWTTPVRPGIGKHQAPGLEGCQHSLGTFLGQCFVKWQPLKLSSGLCASQEKILGCLPGVTAGRFPHFLYHSPSLFWAEIEMRQWMLCVGSFLQEAMVCLCPTASLSPPLPVCSDT